MLLTLTPFTVLCFDCFSELVSQDGVDRDTLECCHRHVKIPMRGMKNSLNVAVAGTVAMFSVIRRWNAKIQDSGAPL